MTSKTEQTKHTPGPWSVLDTRGALMIGATTPENNDVWIAEVISVDENGDLPEQANARLIAAAPDMLAALERIAYGLEQDGRTADGMTKAGAAKIARAALAKAGAK